MKQILYFTLFFASLGTLGLVATKPELVHQGAEFLGMAPATTPDSPTDRAGDDHLAKFLSQHPEENSLADSIKPEPVIIPPPLIVPTPKTESPGFDPPTTEPPQAQIAVAPVIPFDPFQTNSPAPSPAQTEPPIANSFDPSVQDSEPMGMATTPLANDPGFASSRRSPVSAPLDDLEKWSEPTLISGFTEQASQPIQQMPPANPPIVQNSEPVNDLFLQAANSQPDTNNFAQPPTQAVQPPVNSVYAHNPPPNVTSPQPQPAAANVPVSMNTAPQAQVQIFQPTMPKPASQIQISPSVVAEEVPCYGTMMVARVGSQVILMCDLLPQLRRGGLMLVNENLKKMSEEERAQIPPQELEKFVDMFVENQYPAFLQNQITEALVFNDYLLAKSKEERDMFDKKFGEDFDQHEVPAMMKEFGIKNNIELKKFLKDKLGSSLDRERLLWVKSKIAQQWIMFNMQDANGECTHDEMMEFYTEHKDIFTSETRAQYLELFVAFSNHPNEEAAKNKIAWMGNQVVSGFPFEEIAKVNSEGFTASKGGFWDWTKKGSISSQGLEQAVFSLPVDKMSPIIKGDKGFHIIKVVKREEAETTPFIVAQVTIREKIKMQRRLKLQNEFFDELKKRYAVYVFKDRIDFNVSRQPGTDILR